MGDFHRQKERTQGSYRADAHVMLFRSTSFCYNSDKKTYVLHLSQGRGLRGACALPVSAWVFSWDAIALPQAAAVL